MNNELCCIEKEFVSSQRLHDISEVWLYKHEEMNRLDALIQWMIMEMKDKKYENINGHDTVYIYVPFERLLMAQKLLGTITEVLNYCCFCLTTLFENLLFTYDMCVDPQTGTVQIIVRKLFEKEKSTI
jgi:hypothetical protein